jgi:hypothetical protein
VHFFPAKFWVKGQFRQADLADMMASPPEFDPPGGVRRSRGWRAKMTRDPTMAGGVGMMGSDDGVPYFGAGGGQHAGQRSGWPFLLQNVTLPAAVAQSPQNLHLHALVPAEYLTEGGGRVVASPHSLRAVTRLIAGDVEGLYQDGVMVDDASVPQRGRKKVL